MGFIDDDSLNMSGYGIGEIYVGMKKSFSKTITESDVYTYAGIIGDINPVHVNAEYAKTTRFGERIAHGMLTASFFSTIVKFGDTITAAGEVTRIDPEKRIAYMHTTVVNQRGELVVDGEATVMATKP